MPCSFISEGGSLTRPSFRRHLLLVDGENNNQRVECERLDQHQAENQRAADCSRSSRIPRHRLSRSGNRFALAEATKPDAMAIPIPANTGFQSFGLLVAACVPC